MPVCGRGIFSNGAALFWWSFALLRRSIVDKGDDLEKFDAFAAGKKYWDEVIGPTAHAYPEKNNP